MGLPIVRAFSQLAIQTRHRPAQGTVGPGRSAYRRGSTFFTLRVPQNKRTVSTIPRGQRAKPGDQTTNQNGYGYTKTKDRGWVGDHILVMEEHLGRELRPGEYVAFVGANHSPPVTLDMIELRRRGDFRTTAKARIAQIEARIEELEAEKRILEEELGRETVSG